jgi:hypothetical protein
MFDGLSFSLLLPIGLGLSALAMWMVMLFMFRPKAQLQFREDTIVLKLANAKVLRIERSSDEVVVHVDREVARSLRTVAA